MNPSSDDAPDTTKATPPGWHDRFFRWRGWLVIVLGALLFAGLVAFRGWRRPALLDTLAAAPIVAVGIAMRVWARSYLLRGTNTRRVHARRLVVEGPYRRLRNPLYVGNMAIAAGLALAFAGPFAGGALLLLLFALYSVVVRSEESILRTAFPERYDEIARAVPRWVPRLKPIAAGDAGEPPQFLPALRSEAQRIAGASCAWAIALWIASVTVRG
jgi:protein-S-isoprenylcysteine O-methyltransferase Ste14